MNDALFAALEAAAARDPRYAARLESARRRRDAAANPPRGPCQFARRPILRLAVLRCDHPDAGPLATWDSCRTCPHFQEARC